MELALALARLDQDIQVGKTTHLGLISEVLLLERHLLLAQHLEMVGRAAVWGKRAALALAARLRVVLVTLITGRRELVALRALALPAIQTSLGSITALDWGLSIDRPI